MGYIIISTVRIGEIASESWRNTPPLLPKCDWCGSHVPQWTLNIHHYESGKFRPESRGGFVRRLYSTALTQVGSTLRLMWGYQNLRKPFRTLASLSQIIIVIVRTYITTCGRLVAGRGWYSWYWKSREQRCRPVGCFTKRSHRLCYSIVVIVGWWWDQWWRLWKGSTT